MNGEFDYQEETVVEKADFSDVIDGSKFSLRGLNIERGKKVAVNGRDLLYWNEGELVKRMPVGSPPTFRVWRVVSVVFLVIGVGVFVMFYRKRAKHV